MGFGDSSVISVCACVVQTRLTTSVTAPSSAAGRFTYFARGTGLPVTWIQSMREPPPDP